MKRKIWILIITLITLIFIVLFNYQKISYYYFNFQEYWKSRNAIVWNGEKKLTWNDFNFDSKIKPRKFYADVKIGTRYNIDNPVLFRSKTLFFPSKSFVSDTTNNLILRAAQAKWNLLEIHRRIMVNKLDSLKANKTELTIEIMENLNKRCYSDFERDWNNYIGKSNPKRSLEALENRITQELK